VVQGSEVQGPGVQGSEVNIPLLDLPPPFSPQICCCSPRQGILEMDDYGKNAAYQPELLPAKEVESQATKTRAFFKKPTDRLTEPG
jgi:hypothetical protein